MSISTTVLIAFAALVVSVLKDRKRMSYLREILFIIFTKVSLNAEPRPRPQWPGLDNWGGSNPWGNGGWGNGGWGNGGCGNSRGWDRNGYGRPGLPGIPSLPAIPTRRNSGCGWSQGPRGCGCSSCGGYPFGGNRNKNLFFGNQLFFDAFFEYQFLKFEHSFNDFAFIRLFLKCFKTF